MAPHVRRQESLIVSDVLKLPREQPVDKRGDVRVIVRSRPATGGIPDVGNHIAHRHAKATLRHSLKRGLIGRPWVAFAASALVIRELRETASVLDLVADLAGQYGDEFRRTVMDENGRSRSSLLIAMNGEATSWASQPALRNGDQVTLLAPIAGG